ncbi:hypothetical protein GOP47_0027953 [Adiantum capillus-veneris]|nr:hypothetical protein GOP47_0027953 [Adiantum capillus-veneris]
MAPLRFLSLHLKHVAKLAFHPLISQHASHILLLTLSFISLSSSAKQAASNLFHHLRHHLDSPHLILLALAALIIVLLAARRARSRPVYMVDFTCYLPKDDRKVSKQYFIDNSGKIGLFTPESLDFQRKILERSGLGQETYFPPAVTNMPPNPCFLEACLEAETVMFGALDELFAKTKINPRHIGILVVNCSAFCPSPSLAAMIINKYKLRGNIVSYNLAGMGCSAGVIAADLAKWLLSVHANTYAVVVSTENITLNWYRGNEKNMLVSNCIFRMGGSALLLSNKPSAKKSAKFELLHAVRTHRGGEDKCFYCVQQEEDPKGILGVILSKELMSVAGGALRTNITTLGPLVLPYSELVKFIASLVGRHVLKMGIKPYTPNFMKAFEHFCVHAGGRAVLDEVEKSLGLSPYHMEPNRMTLYRFGNTSSSSLWYELAYLEAKGRICRGDRIWQIGFGSGFKCNSAVWRALRHIPAEAVQNCWSGFINDYPVHIPAVDRIEAAQCVAI